MSFELFWALCLFAVVSSVTPGPNNFMLMNSGANFGLRSSVSPLLGVCVGFAVMIVLVGLGVMQLFELYPQSYDILKVFCGIYLVYLAVNIAKSGKLSNDVESAGKPWSFLQAALFQWVNPKAWAMALSAISIYAPSTNLTAVLIVASVFAVVSVPCVGSWVLIGERIQVFLTNQRRLRVFNVSMAVLLVLSMLPVFMDI